MVSVCATGTTYGYVRSLQQTPPENGIKCDDIKNDSQSNQGQTFAEVQRQRRVLEVVRTDTQNSSAPPV